MSPEPDWPGVRLHVVTGKGGTGKTTVASALALTLASLGQRVLLAEVEGRQGISQAFDVAPLSDQEQLVLRVSGGGEVWGLSVDATAALLEYLSIFYRLGRAGSALERIGAIDFATTIAPGVRDVLLIGKIYEAVGRRHDRPRRGDASRGPTDRDPRSPWVYDAVVLDAPPTGRVGHFLGVNEEVAELAKVGPIRAQADSITRMLRSGVCLVHVTTLLEDMPVQETLDAVADLARVRVPLGAIVVNSAREEILSAATVTTIRDGSLDVDAVRAVLHERGVEATGPDVAALVAEAIDHADRIALEDTQLTTLEATGAPLYVLPHVTQGADAGGIRVLAQHLANQAVWS